MWTVLRASLFVCANGLLVSTNMLWVTRMHLQKLCDQFEGGPMCMFPPNFWHSGHPESSTWKVVALCLSKHMFYQHLLAIQQEELTTTSASARIRQMIQCRRQDKNLESDLRRRDNLGLVTSNPATPTATLHSIAWSWFVGSVFNFRPWQSSLGVSVSHVFSIFYVYKSPPGP